MNPPTENEFEFDVFISYSSKDKDWVRGDLLTRIEKAGLRAFVDYRDFARGAPSIKECERGVVKCRKTLIILTPNYLTSGWAEFENIMVQTLDPSNESLRLIPLLKGDCKKPLRIGALTHIDFTDGSDHDLAWRQLLIALGAPPEPEAPKEPKRGDWYLAHPYPMPPNFTGRIDERKMLTDWLEADDAHPLLVLRALGGFGKSSLIWHWLLHDVRPEAWPHVVWWSFYEGDASFDNFLAGTLEYLSGAQIKAHSISPREQLERLVQVLRQPGMLLVLDGFERVLRAFGGLDAAFRGDDGLNADANDHDCISPLTEEFLRKLATLPDVRSKVVITTRVTPRVLEALGSGFLQGCKEEELFQMEPGDAVELFRIHGIRGTRAEIGQACAAYGFHPLSLRILAGLIVKDFQQPGDIAAAQRIGKGSDIDESQEHLLESSYQSLTQSRQELLSSIACFRSPVKYGALKTLAEVEPVEKSEKRKGRLNRNVDRAADAVLSASNLDADLRDLVARGLLHHDTREGRFDLHPIVRRYTYIRLSASERTTIHLRLRDYFATVKGPDPDKVTRLEDLTPVIELYYHTVRAGQYDEACALFRTRINQATYYQLGAYQLRIDLLQLLFPDGEDRPPRLEDQGWQAWVLGAQANSYSRNGQPRRAIPLFEADIAILERVQLHGVLPTPLLNLASDQWRVGALRTAEVNLRRSIELAEAISDEFQELAGHHGLGEVLYACGSYIESASELAAALAIGERRGDIQAQGLVAAYQAQRELLLLRANPDRVLVTARAALALANRALELADEDARVTYPVERDYVRAHWLLGASLLVAVQPKSAECHLHEALERCRRTNAVDAEADILIDISRMQRSGGNLDEAYRFSQEALVISERSGYVIQGADAHLELAKLAVARGDKATALEHAKEARRLATCDGPPDYTYKVAYDEAGALLQELGVKP